MKHPKKTASRKAPKPARISAAEAAALEALGRDLEHLTELGMDIARAHQEKALRLIAADPHAALAPDSEAGREIDRFIEIADTVQEAILERMTLPRPSRPRRAATPTPTPPAPARIAPQPEPPAGRRVLH